MINKYLIVVYGKLSNIMYQPLVWHYLINILIFLISFLGNER